MSTAAGVTLSEIETGHDVPETTNHEGSPRVIPVRIVVVDDHELVRRGVVALLESHAGWKVVADADNGECAVRLVNEHHPDITIVDLVMPGSLDGLAVTRNLMKIAPDSRILILTMHANRELVREILRAGARGYVMKSDAAKNLISAVETLMQGKFFFTPTVSDILLDTFLESPPPVLSDHLLTRREVEIVKLLASGNSNKEVATCLDISLRTTEAHRANIMSKLHLHCVQDLVRFAMKNGIGGL